MGLRPNNCSRLTYYSSTKQSASDKYSNEAIFFRIINAEQVIESDNFILFLPHTNMSRIVRSSVWDQFPQYWDFFFLNIT